MIPNWKHSSWKKPGPIVVSTTNENVSGTLLSPKISENNLNFIFSFMYGRGVQRRQLLFFTRTDNATIEVTKHFPEELGLTFKAQIDITIPGLRAQTMELPE